MSAKFAPARSPNEQVPGGSGPRTWFETSRNWKRSAKADSLMQPVGAPIAASGTAISTPVVTPLLVPAAQPAVTPAVLLLSIVAWMPNGFVPPLSVPGAPVLLPEPSETCVPPPPVG